jgi:hypothetical protein
MYDILPVITIQHPCLYLLEVPARMWNVGNDILPIYLLEILGREWSQIAMAHDILPYLL